MKKIYFRADASASIGYGHFIRTLALADILKDDFECVFFTCHATPYQIGEMDKVCRYVILDEPTHFDDFLSFLSGDEIVVLDNYFFTTDYQKKIRSKGCRLVCVDDMHDKHYVADVVINHGLTDRTLFDVELYTLMCLGYDWALLRSPFLDTCPGGRDCSRMENALVCFGGSDPYRLTEQFVRYLQGIPSIKKIVAVVGDRCQTDAFPQEKVSFRRNLSADEMCALFRDSDVAFLPASTVCLEALSQGIPVVSGFYVDNQKEIYATYVSNGLVSPLGDLLKLDFSSLDYSFLLHTLSSLRKVDMSGIARRYRMLFSNLFNLKGLVVGGYEFVDYRLLTEGQHRMVWNARNDDAVRFQMEHSKLISWSSHLAFVRSLSNKYRKVYFAVYREGILVGSVNYEFVSLTQVERGIFILPSFWGKGDGVRIECALFEILRGKGVGTVTAKVLKSNERSLKFHCKLGYELSSCDEKYNYLIKQLY